MTREQILERVFQLHIEALEFQLNHATVQGATVVAMHKILYQSNGHVVYGLYLNMYPWFCVRDELGLAFR